MRRATFIVSSTLVSIVALLWAGNTNGATPADGLYIGTTDQGRDIEIRVSGGAVDQWYLNFAVSCQYGSASGGIRTTVSQPCAIESDGSFVCGSTTCPFWSGGVNMEVGGVFASDGTVSGSVEVAARIVNHSSGSASAAV